MDNLNLEYTMISGLMKLAIEPILEQQKLNSKLIQLEYKQRLDLETLKQGKQLDFLYRVKFQEISHKFRMEANQNDFELKIKKEEWDDFSKNSWPLKSPITYADVDYIDANYYGVVPINVFITTSLDEDKEKFCKKISNKILQFVDSSNFNLNGHNPIRCRFGAWKEGYDTRENINSLWKFLKGSPVIIIIPVWTDTKQLQFDICMWGNSISNIGYTTIHPESLVFDLNCKNDINEIAASICYYVGLISDLYHMIFYASQPQMPFVMENMFSDFHIPESSVHLYRATLYDLIETNYHKEEITDLYFKMVKSIGNIKENWVEKHIWQLITEYVSYKSNGVCEISKDINELVKNIVKYFEKKDSQILGEFVECIKLSGHEIEYDQLLREFDENMFIPIGEGYENKLTLSRGTPIPLKWRNKFGFNWKLSYNEWMELFRKLGFEIDITYYPRENYMSIYHFNIFRAEFKAKSSKYEVEFILIFNNIIELLDTEDGCNKEDTLNYIYLN